MAIKDTSSKRDQKGKENRKGIHTKSKSSKMKSSKNYLKRYKGQGR